MVAVLLAPSPKSVGTSPAIRAVTHYLVDIVVDIEPRLGPVATADYWMIFFVTVFLWTDDYTDLFGALKTGG
jgi:hypothetical protein